MPPTSGEHGRISVNLILPLGLYVRENRLGDIYVSETGFRVGERVLVPDIAFLSTERIPADLSKVFPIPPDLAIEVVSPTDALHRVEEKALPTGAGTLYVLKPHPNGNVYRSETNNTPHAE